MAPKSLFVIDPVNRTGKISIPMELTDETKGLSEYLKSSNTAAAAQRDLSLCLLFQKGRCNAGARCHQIHADRDYVTLLREKANSTSTCCAAHGDVHSTTLVSDARKVHVVSVDGNVSIHTVSQFGATQALEVLLRNNSNSSTIRVSVNKICRLHGQSRCKFGRDCKNFHICRDANTNSSQSSSATSTPVKGTPESRPLEVPQVKVEAVALPVAAAPAIPTKRAVLPPQPADYFRLDDLATVCAPTPSKQLSVPMTPMTPMTPYTPSTVGFSPMSSSFQILTPATSTTSQASKCSAIVRPLKFAEIQESQSTISNMFDNVLFQRPLTRSKIGISPSNFSQSELDVRRLCDDILGALSPSWVMA